MTDINHERKLGRGLSALLGESKAKDLHNVSHGKNNGAVELVPIDKISAGIYQPRKIFDHGAIEELANSIKENGLIQPIILRKAGEENNYEIIAGERRFRAATMAGLKAIPAIVKKINNHEALEMAIVENVQRSDLSVTEEANGYKQLIAEFSYTQEQIAKRVGKSRSHVTNLLRLLTLPQKVLDFLDQKLLSMGHARAIISSKFPEKLAQKIVDLSLTVRQAEDLVRDERVEKAQNIPVFVRTESKIKFVNSEHLAALEARLSELSEMDVKISFNSFKNSGRVSIKFNEFEKIQELIEMLELAKRQL